MNVSERIEKLRQLMDTNGIDMYIVPTADFHQSEYVGEHFKARSFITGFTGSAGTAVIAKGESGVPSIEEYIAAALPKGVHWDLTDVLSQWAMVRPTKSW